MKQIKQTQEIVKAVLQDIPETRNSDDELYFHVCKRINPDALLKPFYMVVLHRKEHSLPPFESVRRSRQKIQNEYPELASDRDVRKYRDGLETEVRHYARQ